MNIFITGGTGFIGGKIIADLLPMSNKIYVLARNSKKAFALLDKFTEEEQKKIQIIFGDITEPNLGLPQTVLDKLYGEIDVIYHMAALVKFDEDLKEELFRINYQGTKYTLQFAEKIQAKRFFHVSTAYTLGKREEGKEILYPLDTPFLNPYEESKCLAEHEVFKYQDKMEVSIFRPSIVVGDSKTGEANSSFTLYGFMKALELFKKRIDRKKENMEREVYRIVGNSLGTSNLVPVDYVCRVLVEGLKYAEKGKIYHIVNTNPPINELILHFIRKRLDFPELSVTSTGENLNREEKYLNKLISVFLVYFNRNIQFESKNTESLLRKANQPLLEMTENMLERIIMGYSS